MCRSEATQQNNNINNNNKFLPQLPPPFGPTIQRPPPAPLDHWVTCPQKEADEEEPVKSPRVKTIRVCARDPLLVLFRWGSGEGSPSSPTGRSADPLAEHTRDAAGHCRRHPPVPALASPHPHHPRSGVAGGAGACSPPEPLRCPRRAGAPRNRRAACRTAGGRGAPPAPSRRSPRPRRPSVCLPRCRRRTFVWLPPSPGTAPVTGGCA